MGRLRPSGSHRWIKCPGSIQMQEKFPQLNETSEAAEQGTAAHWVGEQVLMYYTMGSDNSSMMLCSDYLDKVAPNGFMVDQEMVNGADMYITDVLKVCQQDGLLRKLQIEQKIKVSRVHATECEGTPDAWVFNESTRTLNLWDFKFGYVIVNPLCDQLITYAIGIIDELTGGNGANSDIIVNLRIVQPRPYHTDGSIRIHSIKASDLFDEYVTTMKRSAELALSENPPTKSGSHCKYCSAFHACKTANRSSMNAIDVSDSMQIELVPPDQLASHREILNRALESIKGRLNAIDAQIIALINNQTAVKGLSIDNPQTGRLAWTMKPEQVIAFGQLMNVDLSKISVITPNQAKKLIDEKVISRYATRPPGKTIIVESTKSKASRVFGNKKVN